MTAMNTAVEATTIVGKREAGFKSSHIVGAVAGVVTAAANYNQGSTAAGAIAGAVVGGAIGYAIGDVFGITDELGTSARILNGGIAAVGGMGFSGMATGLVDALLKPATQAE